MLILCGLLVPVVAIADAGVPLVAVAWPASWMLLLPIIAVEAVVARRVLRLEWDRSFKISAAANAASTLLGIPLTWALTFAVTAVPAFLAGRFLPDDVAVIIAAPMYATWLPPVQKNTVWMIPTALALLCVPFLLTSVWLEGKIARKMVSTVTTADIRRWAWCANLLSYGGIIITLLINAFILYNRAPVARLRFKFELQH